MSAKHVKKSTRNHPLLKENSPSKVPLYKRLNWTHVVLLTTTPLIALYGFFTTPIHTKTLIWSIVYYYITGLGITAGYHRLWSHRAYKVTPAYEVFLALAGAGAVEGSIFWWCRDHRVHHRYTDTDKDPYDARKGLFYSHIGWMMLKKDSKVVGRADVTDLEENSIILWQHKYYAHLALFFGFIFPTLVAGYLWGDWRGGYFYAAVARLVFVHHATFCVNSIAHWLGETSFDDKHSPRDHFITALLTLGEGYHNFHHEFPQDYRNAIKFYQYDPTKWLILLTSLFGLSYDLKTFPQNEVKKGELQMKEKKIVSEKLKLNWGSPVEKLPVFTQEEFETQIKKSNRKWIVINNIIHDVADFIEDHPGGKALIKSGLGKNMTDAFTGGVYDHSNAARNLLSTMRVGVLQQTKKM